jgi:hypothetical protein
MYHLIGGIWLFDVRLFLNSIKILLKTIKKEENEFLRVLLTIPRECRSVSANGMLEMFWREGCWTIIVNSAQQVGVSFGYITVV